MKSLDEIRGDLRFIREYYRFKKNMKYPFTVLGHGNYEKMIEGYTSIASTAPKRLVQVYEELYLNDKKQKALSIEWKVTEKYIQILNKRLLVFLQARLE